MRRLVRGGRVTKWKGVVAGCAPFPLSLPSIPVLSLGTVLWLGPAFAPSAIVGHFGEAQAACIDLTSGARATAGSNCVGNLSSYANTGIGLTLSTGSQVVFSTGAGSILTMAQPDVTATSTSVSGDGAAYSVEAALGGVVHFNGNATAIAGQSMLSRAFFSVSPNSMIEVDGNLTAQDNGGDAPQVLVDALDGASILVHGNAQVDNAIGEGTRAASGGSVIIEGHSAINTLSTGVSSIMAGGGLPAGSSLVQMNSATVTTSGAGGHGLYAEGNLNNTIVVNGATDITTTGDDAHGVYAVNGGKIFIDPTATGGTADDNTQIVFTGGTVNVSGERTGGLYSFINDTASTGDTLVTMSGGSVTGGWLTRGVASHNQGLGDARITMTDGSISAGTGLWAVVDNLSSSGDAVIDMTGGSINAASSFGNAQGVTAANNGTGSASAHVSNATIFGDVNVGVQANVGNTAATGMASVVIENTTINDTGSVIFSGARATNYGLGGAELSISGSTFTSHGAGLGAGAYLNNANNLNDLTIDITDTDISLVGGVLGVEAQQSGLGATSVTLTRTNVDIGGNGYGMMVSANNTANTSDLDIQLVDSTVSPASPPSRTASASRMSACRARP